MKNTQSVGVIVGRFQIPTLIPEFKEIFNKVLEQKFDKRIVVLSVPPSAVKATKNNPLDFDSRRRMIEDEFGTSFIIKYIKDCKSDLQWSNNLDGLIGQECGECKVTIFGAGEKFINHYVGKYETEKFDSTKIIGDDEIRQRSIASASAFDGNAWRAGAVWSSQNRWPQVLPTVDCAIFDDSAFTYIWMAKKAGETKLRFVGGFGDPSKDTSFEETAIREAKEETGMDCEIVSYICSQKIDDWRFKNETDKIITTMFALVRTAGDPKPDDDIVFLEKVNIKSLKKDDVVEEHGVLLDKLQEWLKNNKKFFVKFKN